MSDPQSNTYNMPNFQSKPLQCVIFWNQIFTTCQNSTQKFNNMSGFESKYYTVSNVDSEKHNVSDFESKSNKLPHFESKDLQCVAF